MKRPHLRTLTIAALACGLTACVNEGASYEILGTDDSISLIREQKYFWAPEVLQYVVVARDKICQRKLDMVDGVADSVNIQIYEAAPELYVLRQSRVWYALSTAECRMQKFDVPPDASKLTERGSFRYPAEGDLKFYDAAPVPVK